MPPEIQAAYDQGATVTFVKVLQRWEVYRPLEPPQDLSEDALNLMHNFELGLLPPRVQKRLAELFAANPPDIFERLEKAAAYEKAKAA
jgi:hypothetical protein